MSQDGKRDAAARQRRVRRLKHLIIGTILILILLPIVCCVVLLIQVHDMNGRIDELSQRVAVLEQRNNASGTEAGAEIYPTEQPGTDNINVSENQAEDSRHKVYLTFDDGPSAYTGEILDILAQYDVKATFFVVGKEDEASEALLRRIVEEGHTLGMHSYSHKYADLYKSEESFIADFEKQRTYLEAVTGTSCKFYRFPGGSSNTVSNMDMHIFADYLDTQGVVFYDWNIASGDGGRRLLDVDTLVKNSTTDVGKWNCSVILLHDSVEKGTTVDALPEIIETIQAMEDTVFLPITEDSEPVQHIDRAIENGGTN